VRSVPAPILRVRVRVVRVSTETGVASDVGEVATFGVDDVPDLLLTEERGVRGGRKWEEGERANLVVSELDARNHDDPPVPSVPIVVTDERALRSRTLPRRELRHAELDVRVHVKRCRVEYGDSVPARLNLEREVALETVGIFEVAEDGFERGVFEGGTVHIAGDPAAKGVRGSEKG
jgi:hypothetical protein